MRSIPARIEENVSIRQSLSLCITQSNGSSPSKKWEIVPIFWILPILAASRMGTNFPKSSGLFLFWAVHTHCVPQFYSKRSSPANSSYSSEEKLKPAEQTKPVFPTGIRMPSFSTCTASTRHSASVIGFRKNLHS